MLYCNDLDGVVEIECAGPTVVCKCAPFLILARLCSCRPSDCIRTNTSQISLSMSALVCFCFHHDSLSASLQLLKLL